MPIPNPPAPFAGSVLARVGAKLDGRPFRIGWGGDNNNVWDFMTAVCQHSYNNFDCAVIESNDSDLKESLRIAKQDLGKVIGVINPRGDERWQYHYGVLGHFIDV